MKKLILLALLSFGMAQLYSADSCTAAKSSISAYGIGDIQDTDNVDIYTMDGKIYIKMNGEYEVTVFNLLGQMLYENENCSGETIVSVNKGIYIVYVRWEGGSTSKRVVVK